jgi:acetyl esterase/lipase
MDDPGTMAAFEPAAMAPSAQSRWLAGLLRRTMRPLSAVTPPGPIGVVSTRAFLWTAMVAVARVPRGSRITPVDRRWNGRRVVGEWVRGPRAVRDDAVVLYVHGSGYVACSLRTHRGLVAELSSVCGLPVFSLEYRLAPRYQFPSAADDVLHGYRWLIEQGYAPERIVLAGDSAGGHLVIGLAAELCAGKLPLPAGVVAFSPCVDPTFALGATRDAVVRDPMVTAAAARRLVARYIRGCDLDDPRLSLLRCSAEGMPPMLVQAGGLELMSIDAEEIAALVNAAGGSCELQVWPGQMHVFQALYALVPEAHRALRHAARFIAGVLPEADAPATDVATRAA